MIRTAPIVLIAALAAGPNPALAAPPMPEGLDTRCAETVLEDCTVEGFGVTSVYDDFYIAFQIQHGVDDFGGASGGLVLYEEKDGEWSLLASDFDGFTYELPRLIEAEIMILHVPGLMMGTGSMNADLLFVQDVEDPQGWREIDLESWRDEMEPLLPQGLEIWKGVDFDFADWFWGDYTARTALWRASDANCCPSGGWATITFDIGEDRLIPRSVDYTPPEGRSED